MIRSTLAVLLAVVALACGGAPMATRAPESTPVAEASAPARVCVHVDIGLDLRALPQPASQASIDMFTLGQIDDFRELAPPASNVELRYQPGVGAMTADFTGVDEASARTACEQTVDRYMEQAPRLPILMEPAAQVTVPCAPCP